MAIVHPSTTMDQATGTKNPIKELMTRTVKSREYYPLSALNLDTAIHFPSGLKAIFCSRLIQKVPLAPGSRWQSADTLEGARWGLPDSTSAPSTDSCPDKKDWEQNFHRELNWNLQPLTFWQFTWNRAKEGKHPFEYFTKSLQKRKEVVIVIGPRCPWSDLWVCLSLSNWVSIPLCKLNWCDSSWWRYKLITNW